MKRAMLSKMQLHPGPSALVRRTLGCVLTLCAAGCAPQPIVGEDVMPLDGAMHLEDMGQAGAYGRNPDAKAPIRDVGVASDRFAGLRNALEERWVHREIHAAEGIDVGAVLEVLRDETSVARGRGERRAAVRRATCRLGDGQLRLLERHSENDDDSGLRVRAVGTGFLIEGTDGRYDRELGPGDMVVAVDDVEVARWFDTTCVAPGSSDGQRRARLAQSLERAITSREFGRSRAARVTVRRAKSGKVREVTLLWRDEVRSPCVTGESITANVGMVTVQRLDCDPATFASQLTAADDAAGTGHVMLDLRRVHGGDEANAQALARRFAPASTVWATKRAGTRGAFTDVPLPEAGPPVQANTRWLLLSPRCSGPCELAASVIAADAGVTTVGRPTAGSVAETDPVSVGKRTTVLVPTVQFALPGTATLLEGRGVTPDISVTATVDVLARGHDPEVVAAARRIDQGS